MFSVTWPPARGLISALQCDYPGRLPALCSELFSSQGFAFFFFFSSLPPSLCQTRSGYYGSGKESFKKTHTRTHNKVERHAFIQMCSREQRERQLTYPVGPAGRRGLLLAQAVAAVTVAGINRPSLCTLWEGVGLVPRSCFSSLTLFPRHCGVPNAQRKTVRLSTGHVPVVPRKPQGARPMEHERRETGSQEGWSEYPQDTKANLASWLPLPLLGGLC